MDLQGTIIKNHLKIDKEISQGRISDVYIACDLFENNARRAVKFLKNSEISDRIEDVIRFRTEVNTIAEFGHQNVIRIYEVGEIGGLNYIVMEYVEGNSLEQLMLNQPASLELNVDYMIQVFRALGFLHSHNIIHRDLKPNNILVQDGELKVIDAGIARVKEFNESIPAEQVSGVFGYVSPEQIGFVKRSIDERSDFYSAGVIFYQLLTGCRPFAGDAISAIIHQQISTTPAVPSSINPEIPELLDDIVLKLLEKEPENRYQSEQGIISDLEKFIEGKRDFVPGLNDTSIRLRFRTKLVGRERELASLKNIFDNVLKGKGGICFITGDAGTGKTRLGEEFRDFVISNRRLFINGRCFDQGTRMPYEPFREILSSYLMSFGNYPEPRKREIINDIRSEFRNLGKILINLNPEMKVILGNCPALVALTPEREHERFHMIISQFFLRLSDIEGGLVLYIDDLHNADESTLNLLTSLLNSISGHPLMILGCYREEGLPPGHSLLKYLSTLMLQDQSYEIIRLDLFDPIRMKRFISSLLNESEEDIEELSGYLSSKSRGNLFFAMESIKQLIDEQALSYQNNRWIFNGKAIEAVESSVSIVDIILGRINQFDENEQEILSNVAVIGERFNMELLFKLNQYKKIDVIKTIDKAIEFHILEDLPQWGEVGFVHAQIREIFYENIKKDKRKRMHLATADAIEKMHPGELGNFFFDIAHHFIEGGDQDRTLVFAFPAGMRAIRNYANEDALKYFNLAENIIEKQGMAEGKQWVAILRNKSKVYFSLGKYHEAIALLQRIFPFMETDYEKARIYNQICNAYFQLGTWNSCERFAKKGLQLLGERLSVRPFDILFRTVKEMIIHLVHMLFPQFYMREKKRPDSKKYTLIVQFNTTLGWMYLLSNISKFNASMLRTLNVTERKLGKSRALAGCIAGYASLLMSVPRFDVALEYHFRALKMREELDDKLGIAQSLQWIGFCYEWRGNFKIALEYFGKSSQIYNTVGEMRENGMSLGGQVNTYYFMSDYYKARLANEQYINIARNSQDVFLLCYSQTMMALCAIQLGDYDDAERIALEVHDLSNKNEIWFHFCVANTVLGFLYTEKGEPGMALNYLQVAKDLYVKKGFIKHYTILLYPVIALSHIEDYIKNKKQYKDKQRFYFKRMRQAAKESMRKTKRWVGHHGVSLLVYAKYHAIVGNNKKAETYFIRAREHNENHGLRYWLAKTYFEHGLFLYQIGNTLDARKNLEMAYRIFSEIGSKAFIPRIQELLGITEDTVDSSSIQRLVEKERLTAITRFAQDISYLSDAGKLTSEVMSRAVEITGAQRGCLFVAGEDGQLERKAIFSVTDRYFSEYSMYIVDQVNTSGSSVVISDVQEQDILANQAVAPPPYSLKSVLCAPIKERESAIGVCYLDSSLSTGVFSENTVDILDAFLSQVAFAIKIELLHQRLEMTQKVTKKPSILSSLSTEKIKKAVEYINENFTSDISREGLAAYIGVHPDNLGKYFKLYLGKKMNEYINELRIKEASRYLLETDKKVIDIACEVGFESLRTFNKAFREVMKTSPAKYRKQQ